MKINKKALQCFAACWILLFHIWINVSESDIEQFFIRIGYIGVDLFFFLSAYSLSGKKIHYKSFLKNRFFSIYLPFVLFLLLAAAWKKFTFLRILKIVSGIELLQKGGGAFLWFLPAICLMYIVFPLLVNRNAHPVSKSLFVLVFWFICSMISDHLFGYSQIFIFTNRIPAILLGYLCRQIPEDSKHSAIPHRKNLRAFSPWIRFSLSLLLIGAGAAFAFRFGYRHKLQCPFSDFFYVLDLPLLIGIIMLFDFLPNMNSRFEKMIASATLELYALQMIIGTTISARCYRLTGSPILSNLLCIAVLLAISVILNIVYRKIMTRLRLLS